MDTDGAPLPPISEKAVRRTYRKGEKILRPYDETDSIFTVISGYVKVYTINDQGVEQIQFIYGYLEIFPVSWFAGRNKVLTYFEAMTDCELDVLPKKGLKNMLLARPEAGYLMLTKVSAMFVNYLTQVNNLEYTYATERLAFQLLVLAERFGENTEEGILLPPFSYQTIGNLINLSRESVNREMAKFISQNLVAVKKNRIYLLEVLALKRKVDRDGTNLVVENLANMTHLG